MELFSGLIGVGIGSVITGIISWLIFRKQNKIDRYLSFVDDIDTALNKVDQISTTLEGKDKLQHEINLLLNKAYSKAMISMDDKLFKKINLLLDKGFDKKSRNRIYYLMRKDIFGRKTKINFDELIEKYIQATIKTPKD